MKLVALIFEKRREVGTVAAVRTQVTTPETSGDEDIFHSGKLLNIFAVVEYDCEFVEGCVTFVVCFYVM